MTCTIIDERIISRYLVVEDLVRKKRDCTDVLPSAASKLGISSQQARTNLDILILSIIFSPCKTNSCKNLVQM